MTQTLSDRRARRGFTLLEMVVVLAIIGLISALVGPRLFGTLERGQAQTARAQMALLSTGIELFRVDMGRLPTATEGLKALLRAPFESGNWHGPYLRADTLPKDPWGRDFLYARDAAHPAGFRLTSLGADGAPGGEDAGADITGP